jgi:glycosyltransferase involved in cell wall biosynthesis
VSGREEIQLVIGGEALLTSMVGVGVYTARLLTGLVQASIGFRVLVDESLRGCLEIPDQNCVFLPASHLPHPLLRQIQRANTATALAIRNFPTAIFHSPAPFWSWRRPAKTIVTLHDCIYRHYPAYLGFARWRKLFAVATERYAAESNVVLTDSEFSKTDLTENAGIAAGKLKVLHPWVPLQPVDTTDVATFRLRNGLPARFWLYVGGYDYRKNVELLIEAYAAAIKMAKCPPLVLAGEVPNRTERPYSDVRGAIQHFGIASECVLAGGIASEDMPALYAAADLLVFPSLYEGFGLPAIEAISAGTPVLVSDASSLPEIVTPPHCRFDPRSSNQLRDKLVQAAKDPGTFRCELNEEFTERYAIGRYLELLQTIG